MGLTIDYFYSLTWRQFLNISEGYSKKQQNESRERMLIMRKLMYATIMVHAKEGFVETDLMLFPWEEEEMKLKLLEEEAMMEEIVKNNTDFWDKYDSKKMGKA